MYRRLREEQFCSDEHKDKYLSNQQQLALMRLQEVHTSLHPAPAVEETVEEPDESLAFHSTADYAGQNSGVRRRQSRAIGDNPRREIEAGAAVAVLAEPEVDEQPLARYGGDGFGGYGKNPPPDVYSTVFGGHEPEVETPEIDQYAEAALGTAVDLAGGEADVQAPVDEDLPSFANLVDEGTIYFAEPDHGPRLVQLTPEAAAWSIIFPLMPWELATDLQADLADLEQIRLDSAVPAMAEPIFEPYRPTVRPISRARLMSGVVAAVAFEHPAEGICSPLMDEPLAASAPETQLLPIYFFARTQGANPLAFLRANIQPDLEAPAPGFPRTKLGIAADASHKGLRGLARLGGRTAQGAGGVNAWNVAVDFWEHAPRDLRILAVAIPVLLGLALHPSLPKVHVTAPVAAATTGSEAASPGLTSGLTSGWTAGWDDKLQQRWSTLKHKLAERAAIDLNEDFRSGLEEWKSSTPTRTGWTFDQSGFIHPAEMALYRPTLGLGDYELRFLAMIDKSGLNWVVRAKDFKNYYAVRLYVSKPGPLPELRLSRHAVVDGKAGTSTDVPVRINGRTDTIYRIAVNVQQNNYSVSVQDSVVDSWTDSQLTQGGVGFYSPNGDASRVRWLQVTHQSDVLGRICAYFASPELVGESLENSSLQSGGVESSRIQNTKGRW